MDTLNTNKNTTKVQMGRGTYVCMDCLKPKKWILSERCNHCSSRRITKKVWANPVHRSNRIEVFKNSPRFKAAKKSPSFLIAMRSPERRKKLSESMIKRWANPRARAKQRETLKESHKRPEIREKFSGPNSCHWRGGCINSRRAYGANWTNLVREQIRNRDNYLCQNPGCYLPENGRKHAIHHIDFNKTNFSPENLITLCIACHGKTSSGNREYWETRLRSIQEVRGIRKNQ